MVSTNVDLVQIIDNTGSMTPYIDSVKKMALGFHKELESRLAEYQREIETLRVKVILFRDLDYEGSEAFVQSRFFELPREEKEYSDFVNGIECDGGGDAAESGFEAVALGMCSDWNTEGDKKRHIIMFCSDAPPKTIKGPCSLVQGLPDSMKEFKSWWCDAQTGKMDPRAKRMIVFAPECPEWNEVCEEFPMVFYKAVEPGAGLADLEKEILFKTLCGTITSNGAN